MSTPPDGAQQPQHSGGHQPPIDPHGSHSMPSAPSGPGGYPPAGASQPPGAHAQQPAGGGYPQQPPGGGYSHQPPMGPGPGGYGGGYGPGGQPPQKSRLPLIIGVIVGAAVIALGAIFIPKLLQKDPPPPAPPLPPTAVDPNVDVTYYDSPGPTLGTKSVYDIGLGDCMLAETVEGPNADQSNIVIIGCDTPHDAEVYAAFNLTDPDYPGDEAVYNTSRELCGESFLDYVGLEPQESSLQIKMFYPVEASWAQGDRAIVCIAMDSQFYSGTLEGAYR